MGRLKIQELDTKLDLEISITSKDRVSTREVPSR